MNEVIAKKKLKDWKGELFYWCLIALPLLQFLIMYVYVNFNSITMAFQTYDGITDKWSWVGFQQFEFVFRDIAKPGVLQVAIKNSLVSWLLGYIGLPFGLLFAYYIYKKFPGGCFFRVILFLPSILSMNILMIIFKFYANDFLPTIINSIFKTSLPGFLSDPNYQFPSIMIFNIFMGFGLSVLMYTGAMTTISQSVIEAGQLDGVNALQEFGLLVLPQIVGTVSVFIVTGIAGIFTNQMNLYSLYFEAAEMHLYTVGYYLYRNVQQASSYAEYPYYAALGLLITAVIAPIVFGVRALFKKLDPMGE